MKKMLLVLSILYSFSAPAHAQPSETVGHIQTLKGEAYLLRGNTSIPVRVGGQIFSGDAIKTTKTGSVGIVMTDDSSLSLGPDSEIVLKDYLFNPKEGKFAFLTQMVKGTFVYLSGIIGKLSPDSIKIVIPDATIAVRGTKLLVKVEE